MMGVETTPKVKAASQEAVKAMQEFDEAKVGGVKKAVNFRERKNYFFVFLTFMDDSCQMSHGLKGAGEINEWINTRPGTLDKMIKTVDVIFGHHRRARSETKVVFK